MSAESAALPPDLLKAVASRSGLVALVLGAGCSIESPTSLKSSRAYSNNAHRQLVADQVIESDDFSEPDDLAALAEFVFESTGSQRDLVVRLPSNEFRHARPNSGHLDTAALMLEGAINCVITLNYDLALNNALTELGANQIDIIKQHDEVGNLGSKCIIYLHGNVESDDEDWILRVEDLENTWASTWKELVTLRVAMTPHVAFAGLGSRAAILASSVEKVRSICQSASSIYFADPADTSRFAQELALEPGNSFQLTWCQFMKLLADRVVQECCEEINQAGHSLAFEKNISLENGRFDDLVRCLQEAGLRALGSLRAIWLRQSLPYYPDGDLARNFLARVLVALGMRLTDPRYEFSVLEHGRIGVVNKQGVRRSILGLHGMGKDSWVEAINQLEELIDDMSDPPDVVAATGFNGQRPSNISTPESIGPSYSEDCLIGGRRGPRLLDIEELDASDRLFDEFVS